MLQFARLRVHHSFQFLTLLTEEFCAVVFCPMDTTEMCFRPPVIHHNEEFVLATFPFVCLKDPSTEYAMTMVMSRELIDRWGLDETEVLKFLYIEAQERIEARMKSGDLKQTETFAITRATHPHAKCPLDLSGIHLPE